MNRINLTVQITDSCGMKIRLLFFKIDKMRIEVPVNQLIIIHVSQ